MKTTIFTAIAMILFSVNTYATRSNAVPSASDSALSRRTGVAQNQEEADLLYAKASVWLQQYGGQMSLDFDDTPSKEQEIQNKDYLCAAFQGSAFRISV